MYVHILINFYIQLSMLSSTQPNIYQAIIHFGLGYRKWMELDTNHVLFLIVPADSISSPLVPLHHRNLLTTMPQKNFSNSRGMVNLFHAMTSCILHSQTIIIGCHLRLCIMYNNQWSYKSGM